MVGPAHRELLASVLRSHIVMCHTLLPADLARPRNLTSLSGTVMTTRSQEVTNHRAAWIYGAITDSSYHMNSSSPYKNLIRILI